MARLENGAVPYPFSGDEHGQGQFLPYRFQFCILRKGVQNDQRLRRWIIQFRNGTEVTNGTSWVCRNLLPSAYSKH